MIGGGLKRFGITRGGGGGGGKTFWEGGFRFWGGGGWWCGVGIECPITRHKKGM